MHALNVSFAAGPIDHMVMLKSFDLPTMLHMSDNACSALRLIIACTQSAKGRLVCRYMLSPSCLGTSSEEWTSVSSWRSPLAPSWIRSLSTGWSASSTRLIRCRRVLIQMRPLLCRLLATPAALVRHLVFRACNVLVLGISHSCHGNAEGCCSGAPDLLQEACTMQVASDTQLPAFHQCKV